MTNFCFQTLFQSCVLPSYIVQIDKSKEYQDALKYFDEGKNLFITGAAGTGKSTLIKQIYKRAGPQFTAAVGPTGVSAIHLPNGQTIHSALRIPTDFLSDNEYKNYFEKNYFVAQQPRKTTDESNSNDEKIVSPFKIFIDNLNILIVDEISMVSAHMLEVMDLCLRIYKNRNYLPFGGVQVVFVGDFCQLPPVFVEKSNPPPPPNQEFLAFESPVWVSLKLQTIFLTKIFRQENVEFSLLLNTIRLNRPLTSSQCNMLSNCTKKPYPKYDCLTIAHSRKDVANINDTEIKQLILQGKKKETYPFPYSVFVQDYFSKSKEQKNKQSDFESKNINGYDQILTTAEDDLNITILHNLQDNVTDTLMMESKNEQMFLIDMNVMIIRNVLGLVNGDRGIVVDFCTEKRAAAEGYTMKKPTWSYDLDEDIKYPVVHIERLKKEYLIQPIKWTKTKLCPINHQMEIVASVSAIPLIPAYAITAHRSQGITIYDDTLVHINATMMNICEGSFYVALMYQFQTPKGLNKIQQQFLFMKIDLSLKMQKNMNK